MRTKLDRNPTLYALALIGLPILFGCGDDRSSIRRYQVPHEPPAPTTTTAASAGSSQRMIAAIVPHGAQAWFFKAMGESDEIEKLAADFDSVVRSVSFEDDRPKWTLPDGWTEGEGGQFRFATLRRDTAEIAVSQLPLPNDDLDGYVLANINRWRDQVSQPSVTKGELPNITQRIELNDGSAIIYDSGPTTKPSTAISPSPSESSSPVTYDMPEGWRKEGRRPMRLATFTVERDGKKIEIVLSRLGPNAGSVVDNVNRWRGQIGLSDAENEAIKNDLRSVEVDGNASDYIQIIAAESERVIYVVIVKRPDMTLFVKLTGDLALAEDETANFEKFARSIRFSS